MSENKNKLIQHASIEWSDQSEPFSPLFNDVYFNTEEGINESLYVFIQGNNLEKRWRDHNNRLFSIAETGFGTGLNFLITCREFQKFQLANPTASLRRLHFTSFEKYPLNKRDLENALKRWPSLNEFIIPLLEQYPLPLTGCQRITFDKFNISLDLWFGDVIETLPSVYHYKQGIFDCWYLDGFAPSKNPDMWSEQLFKQIADTCKRDATIATFTAAGFVRRGLIAVGFAMQKCPGYGKKREMLIGQFTRTRLASETQRDDVLAIAGNKIDDIALIGDNLSSACLALALIKRGYKVTLYCKDAALSCDNVNTRQTYLYPRLNAQHDSASQLSANSFLYAHHYIKQIARAFPFKFELSGLDELNCEHLATLQKDNLLQGQFPAQLVGECPQQPAESIVNYKNNQPLCYPLAGWVDYKEMRRSILSKASQLGDLTVNEAQKLHSLTQKKSTWQLNFGNKSFNHSLLIITTGFEQLDQNLRGDHVAISDISNNNIPYLGALSNNHTTNANHPPIYDNLYLLTELEKDEVCNAPLFAELLACVISKEPLPITSQILQFLQRK